MADMDVIVHIKRLDAFPHDWELPSYATAGAAAVDLRNAGPDVVLEPMQRMLIPTALAIALPHGYEAQVRPRSGLSLKRGIGLVNSPGTIDSDYRGELLIPVINFDRAAQRLEHGERVAQMVIAPVARVAWSETSALPETERAAGGFGSTGTK
jgi:dUTP pyrophosphatase